MNEQNKATSAAERDVLKALWELGPSAVREIREFFKRQGRRWAHTTVNTLLARLEEKQLVARDTSGFALVFTAAVSRTQFVQGQMADLADQYFHGKSIPLVLALVEEQEFSDQDIEDFRELLDRLEKKSGKTTTRRRKPGGKSKR